MAVSKSQQAAVNRYISKSYDRINLTLPKGWKEELEAHVQTTGESINSFIRRAIDETMERDSANKSEES